MQYIFTLLLTLILSSAAMAKSNLIIGEDGTEMLNTFDTQSEIYQLSKATGRIERPGTLGLRDYCTVFLINNNQVVTAAHCFKDGQGVGYKVFFEYYDRGSKTKNPFKVTKVVTLSREKDFAVLELEGEPGKVYGHYKFAKAAPEVNDELMIYQHQGLSAKSISKIDCKFLGYKDQQIMHGCDTNNYSSGSPILNRHFEVVAVHQGGFATMNDLFNVGTLLIGVIEE